MQANSVKLYKDVSDKTGLDHSLVQLVGSSVFMEMNRLTSAPPNLILILRGIGRRFVRRKRSEEILKNLRFYYSDPESRVDKKQVKKEIEFLTNLLSKYDAFVEKKRYLKKLRHAPETLMEPPVQQEEVQKTSNNNL